MTRDEIRARFRGVVARALAKPLSELPYRVPVTSRFHYGGATAPFADETWRVKNGATTQKALKKRANPAALPGPTSMDSGDLTAVSNLRSRPREDRPARREVTSVSDEDPGLLEYHVVNGRTTVRFSHDEI